MRTHVGIVLTLRPKAEQLALLRRNAGASRFAWNWCVARFRAQKAERAQHPEHKMLYTAFDYINAFNQWKVSAQAGHSETTGVGLAWRKEVTAHVMEEAAADCGKAVRAFFRNSRDRRTKKTKRVVGPPQFKDRFVAEDSFRLRNTNGKRFTVSKKGVTVPVVGYLRPREGTARLRSLLRAGSAFEAGRILAATLSFIDGRWRLSLKLEVDARSITERQWPTNAGSVHYPTLGCDLGIKSLVCLAAPDGSFSQHCLAPEAVDGLHKTIRGHQRRLAAKREASRRRAREAGTQGPTVGKSEARARLRLQRRFARQRNARRDNLHLLTTDLARQCDVVGIEDLHVAGMLQNHRLARAVAQQAWGEFRSQLTYKMAWARKRLIVVNRFFPSSKRCSQCSVTKGSLRLSERTFGCNVCSANFHRDVNGAANLAQEALRLIDASPEELGKVKRRSRTDQGRPLRPPGVCPLVPVYSRSHFMRPYNLNL